MQWIDDGIVLTRQRHGEHAAVVSLLTREHGRHAGLVRGAMGPRLRGVIEPGNEVSAEWRARLSEHLGQYRLELKTAHAATAFGAPLRLLALISAAALTERTLAEHEPHPTLFAAFQALLQALDMSAEWPAVYARFELGLLAELGYGLDLEACAVSGATEGLAYVSPRTGRAVALGHAGGYEDRLLPLPAFLAESGGAPAANDPLIDIRNGLRLTGHFLEQRVFAPHERKMPVARERLIEGLARLDTISRVG
jgi:DNA repair protein RecO (recombination protein O)